LLGGVSGKIDELGSAGLAGDFQGARAQNAEFREYKKGVKRQWVTEQNDLAALFTTIQAKLKSMNRPVYVPPHGLAVPDVEGNFVALNGAEQTRRTALNQNLRAILDGLRKAFADPANAFYDKLQHLKSHLTTLEGDLGSQLAAAQHKQKELQALAGGLGPIQGAEQELEAANVEDNEFSIHTYDDLAFEFEQVTRAFAKAIVSIEGQIAASKQTGVSAEQIEDFKRSFQHFDQDKNGSLSRLEFKSAMGSMGLIELSFEGTDAKFDALFKQVGGGADHVSFQQYVDYLVKVNADTISPDQLKDSFATVAGNKDHVTVNDMKVAQLKPELIDYLVSVMPKHASIPDAYDYKAYLTTM
jgi:Ca2+-binding EF-hand superfamily protein